MSLNILPFQLSVSGGGVGGASNLVTAGAVAFVASAGVLTQDATKLFWDNTNDRLGVGNNAPAVPLEVTGIVRAQEFQPAMSTVTFSATPAFDLSLGNTIFIALTGNVTSSTFTNARAGLHITFVIQQDPASARTFAWPTGAKGAMTIGATLSGYNVQTFVCIDASTLLATSTGAINLT